MDKTHRDKAYLLHLRDEPCLFTGLRGSGQESVVAAHIGTAGKGIKSPDNEAIPVANHVHQLMHTQGEIHTLLVFLTQRENHSLLRDMARAYARELYAEWLTQSADTTSAEGYRGPVDLAR